VAEPAQPLLDDKALAALNRTRPWLYFLGILACLLAAFSVFAILIAVLGAEMHTSTAPKLLATGIVLLLISVPTAFVQLGYAAALSRVGQAGASEMAAAVELACVRQRNVWIVNAFTVGLMAMVTVFHLLVKLHLFN
jgi:hypothetical protein